MTYLDWRQRAACKSIPPEAFFPPGRSDSHARKARVAEAVAICVPCPVRADCADDAIRRGAAHGVIAGVDLGDSSVIRVLSPEKEAALREVIEGAS